jgi:transcriptional regulator with XRE-family HTH domain
MAGPAMTGRGRDGRRTRPLLRTMIGDVLRRTRRAQRRTLADVSEAARVSVPYLSEIERGRKEASSEVLAAICDALRIDLSELLGGVTHTLAGGAGDRAAARPPETSRDGEVVRLDLARVHRARPQAHGPGDTVCLLAA